MELKIKRQIAITDARRALILEAAQRVLSRSGLENASMREIAKEAGYTPGAIYSYFSGKQMIMTALLESMLHRLATATEQSVSLKTLPEQAMGVRARAWVTYLMENALDKQVLLHLYQTVGNQKKDPKEGPRIHDLVIQTLDPLIRSAPLASLDPVVAKSELEVIWSHALGLLLAAEADGPAVSAQVVCERFTQYLDRLSNSLGVIVKSQPLDAEKNVAQLDMFE
jgi:AcrR family transcriptional regulator